MYVSAKSFTMLTLAKTLGWARDMGMGCNYILYVFEWHIPMKQRCLIQAHGVAQEKRGGIKAKGNLS